MPLIETKNIKKTYTMGEIKLEVLKGINLTIDIGEFVAVMGPSGSGKSTFMNLLGCLDKPTEGKYFLDGQDMTSLNDNNLAEIRSAKLGFVFQGFNLLSRTSALENVELPMIYSKIPPKERQERAMEALKSVNLEDRAGHAPNQLSGGQQQRIAIARAIVNDAPIIFADEPTGNLDTKTSIEIMNLFIKLNSELKRTIILVTHENDIAEFSKRIIRFQDGEIISDEVNCD